MNPPHFDWESFVSRGFGPAAEVPLALANSRALSDSEEVLDLVEPLLRFALDGEVLSAAAAPFADALLGESALAFASERRASPYLAVVSKLFDARAYEEDVPGLVPQDSITSWRERPFGERALHAVEQRRHLDSVASVVAARSEGLRQIAGKGHAADRIHAVAVLHLADCLSGENDTTLLGLALSSVSSPGHVASLLLPLAALNCKSAGNPCEARVVSFLHSPSPYLRAAAWSSMHGVGLPGQATERVARNELEVKPEEIERLLEAADQHDFDYVWHDGLLAGELCRAIFHSRLTFGEKSSLLGKALNRRTKPPNEFLVSPSVAATAAWFYLRLHFAAHYRRPTPLDPQDLSVDERRALSVLHATMPNWILLGSDFPNSFALWQFAMTAPWLIECTQFLGKELSTPWPCEGKRSTVLGFLIRALSLPRRSAERAAGFELVSRALLHDFDEGSLAALLDEILALPSFPAPELALALLAGRTRISSEMSAPAQPVTGEQMLTELRSALSPSLANALARLLDPSQTGR